MTSQRRTRQAKQKAYRTDLPGRPDARGLALMVLNKVAQKALPLDQVLETILPGDPALSRQDRNLLNAIVFGVLRWRAKLDRVIAHFSRIPLNRLSPSVFNILRMGLFQAMFLERVPAHAIVDTAVTLARATAGPGAAAFVNAVLRKAVHRHPDVPFPDPAGDPSTALAVELSFPAWLIERWINRLGPDRTRQLCQAFNTVAPLTLRVNTLKTDRSQVCCIHRESGLDPVATRVSPHGLSLAVPCRIPEIPGYEAGWFQVQDEAAQLVSLAADPRPGQRILDACAGRGGKTGHLGQLMGNQGLILAVDKDRDRLKLLQTEMARLGITIVCTLSKDLCEPLTTETPGGFDCILVDAPCSGLGVLRRNPDAKWRFGPEHIDRCSRRQGRILSSLAGMVRPEGLIVYAVCSTEPEEGEQVIERFVSAHGQFRVASPLHRLPAAARTLVEPSGFIRTYPDRDGMDGFFIACLRRGG